MVDPLLLLVIGLLWKYLEMTLISFLVLAGKGGGGGALLIETGVDLGMFFVGWPLAVTYNVILTSNSKSKIEK